MEREMININANLIKEPVSTSFFKDGKESQVVNFTLAKGYGKGKEYINCAVYGDKVDVAKTFAKGDFVHVYGYFNHRMKDGKTYTFNGSSLGGKNLVTFEELYDLSNPDEPIKVAEHKDIEDDGQTVLITNRIINIHTTATDKDGKKEIEAAKEVTIIDKVTLEGLEVGTKYKLVGWQMLKENNAELLIDGKKVENEYEFIADKENMEVEIAYTFNATAFCFIY